MATSPRPAALLEDLPLSHSPYSAPPPPPYSPPPPRFSHSGSHVTRYEKRDRSGYFIIFAFLVSLDSYACVRSNGQTRVQYLRQEAKLLAFKYTRVTRCPEIIFRDTGTFTYFLLCPCSSVILNDVTFNNAIYRARAPREGLEPAIQLQLEKKAKVSLFYSVRLV